MDVQTRQNIAYTLELTNKSITKSPTAQLTACEKCILPVGGGCLWPKLYGNGVIPCGNVDTVRQVDDRATTLPLEVFRQ